MQRNHKDKIQTLASQPQHVDINKFVQHLKFIPVRKKALQYQYIQRHDASNKKDDLSTMPPMSYTIITDSTRTKHDPITVTTITKDGSIETTNFAKCGDIIMSGPSSETYVLSPEKFSKFYQEVPSSSSSNHNSSNTDAICSTPAAVISKRSPRLVAKYTHDDRCVTFTAPWGETMLLKPGDYLVKDAGDEGCYYRIGEAEFKETYDDPLEDF